MKIKSAWIIRLQTHVRYLRYLLWEFRWPISVFLTLILGGGFLFHKTYHHKELSFPEACYGIFLLIFVNPNLDFPDEWYLQPVFFLLPIIGLGAVADSVVRLAYLMFTQKNKLQEWQRMVASLQRNHVVVVGVGKVGYQIIKGILELEEPVVAIERQSADSPLLDEILDLKVPVIRGDGRNAKTLEQAGIRDARAIILATSEDLTNLDAGLTARDLNPKARVVLRLFDESLAIKVAGAFAMPAISTAHVAAPAFIAAATGRKVYQRFQLADKHLHLTDVTIGPGSSLLGRSVGDVQIDQQVNIVMHKSASGVSINPDHEVILMRDDVVLVIAPMERLVALETANQAGSTSGGAVRT